MSGLRLGLEIVDVFVAWEQSWVSPNPDSAPANWAAMDWTRISPWVQEIDTEQGRQDPKNDWRAGEATLRLDDRDGRFDPRMLDWIYAATSGKSKVSIDTPIKIQTVPLNLEGIARPYPLLAGIMGGARTDRRVAGNAWVHVDCWDMLKFLNMFPVHARFPRQTVKERVDAVLDYCGWPAASGTAPYYRRYYGSDTRTLCAEVTLKGNKAGDHILHCIRTEGRGAYGAIDQDGNFSLVFRNAQHQEPFKTVRAAFGAAGGLPYQKITWRQDERDFHNQVEVSIYKTGGKSFTLERVGASAALGDTFLEIAACPGPMPKGTKLDFGLGRVIELDQPAAEGDLTLFITPSPADIPIGATAEYSDTVARDADNDSQLLHGKRMPPRSAILEPTLIYAQALATNLQKAYRDPPPRADAIKLSGIANAEVARQLLLRAVGERLTVWDVPFYASQEKVASQDILLQGRTRKIRPQNWWEDWYTSPAPAAKVFWHWKDSNPPVWNQTTRHQF